MIQILHSTRKGKKFMAVYSDNVHPDIHFGQLGSTTYLDSRDDRAKINYNKRHIIDETNPYTAGFLSKYISWNLPTLKQSIADYEKRRLALI